MFKKTVSTILGMIACWAIISPAVHAQNYQVVPGSVHEWSAVSSQGIAFNYSVAEVTNTANVNDRKIMVSVKSENRSYWTRRVVDWNQFDGFFDSQQTLRSLLTSILSHLPGAIKQVANFVLNYLPDSVSSYVIDFLKKCRDFFDGWISDLQNQSGSQAAAAVSTRLANAARIGTANNWNLSSRVAYGLQDATQSNPGAAWTLANRIVNLP